MRAAPAPALGIVATPNIGSRQGLLAASASAYRAPYTVPLAFIWYRQALLLGLGHL